MISVKSRYANSNIVSVPNLSGKNVQVIVPSETQTFTFNYVFVLFGVNDRVDRLAQTYYSDPTQWWRIGDANPEILDWNNVSPGTKIRVPNA
jgi:hypothetical protein